MKIKSNFLAVLCLFGVLVFSSCGKEDTITDSDVAIEESYQDINAFLETNPTTEELDDFLSSISQNVASETGYFYSLDELTEEQLELYNIDLSRSQVATRDCGNVERSVEFYSGPNAFFWAHDPTSGNNIYAAVLEKGDDVVDYIFIQNQSGFIYLSPISECGKYTASLFVKEVACTDLWERIGINKKYYPCE